jgi:two-component system chemotaxis response regulator CheY
MGQEVSMPLVLDLGQCDYDHPQIQTLLESLGATVRRAHNFAEARKLMEQEKFDLILVNRITDIDGTSGLDFISDVKGPEGKNGPKMMLVSNYPDAQIAAVKAGAVLGFGKDFLDSPQTKEKLNAAL